MISSTMSLNMRVLRTFIVAVFTVTFVPTATVQAGDIPADFMVDLDGLTVSESEFVCLALNDYFEARGESLAGRLAVAKVVINRAMDRRYPSNICSVIQQNKARVMHRCQFSWYCDGLPDTPYNSAAWLRSLKLAAAVLQKDSGVADPTGGALWYHAAWVHPSWADNLQVSGVIGGHIFYRDLEGSRYAKTAKKQDPMVPALHRFAEWIESREVRTTAIASR